MPAVRGAMPKQLRQLTWISQCDVALRVSPSYLVGMPVKVLWPQDAAWYLGTVTGWEGEHSWQHKVEYEDGDSELLLLACEKVQCPADLLACAPPPTATQLFALAQCILAKATLLYDEGLAKAARAGRPAAPPSPAMGPAGGRGRGKSAAGPHRPPAASPAAAAGRVGVGETPPEAGWAGGAAAGGRARGVTRVPSILQCQVDALHKRATSILHLAQGARGPLVLPSPPPSPPSTSTQTATAGEALKLLLASRAVSGGLGVQAAMGSRPAALRLLAELQLQRAVVLRPGSGVVGPAWPAPGPQGAAAQCLVRRLLEAWRVFQRAKPGYLQWQDHDVSLKVTPEGMLGRSVRLFWPNHSAWFAGRITDYDAASGKHHVEYSDGDKEWVLLAVEKVRVLCSPGEVLLPPATPSSLRATADHLAAAADVCAARPLSPRSQGRQAPRPGVHGEEHCPDVLRGKAAVLRALAAAMEEQQQQGQSKQQEQRQGQLQQQEGLRQQQGEGQEGQSEKQPQGQSQQQQQGQGGCLKLQPHGTMREDQSQPPAPAPAPEMVAEGEGLKPRHRPRPSLSSDLLRAAKQQKMQHPTAPLPFNCPPGNPTAQLQHPHAFEKGDVAAVTPPVPGNGDASHQQLPPTHTSTSRSTAPTLLLDPDCPTPPEEDYLSIGQGEVVWACYTGSPPWPALLTSSEAAEAAGVAGKATGLGGPKGRKPLRASSSVRVGVVGEGQGEGPGEGREKESERSGAIAYAGVSVWVRYFGEHGWQRLPVSQLVPFKQGLLRGLASPVAQAATSTAVGPRAAGKAGVRGPRARQKGRAPPSVSLAAAEGQLPLDGQQGRPATTPLGLHGPPPGVAEPALEAGGVGGEVVGARVGEAGGEGLLGLGPVAAEPQQGAEQLEPRGVGKAEVRAVPGLKPLSKRTMQRFQTALFELDQYLKEGELPQAMLPCNNDEDFLGEEEGGVSEADLMAETATPPSSRKQARGKKGKDAEELGQANSGAKVAQGPAALLFPRKITTSLTVLSLGEVDWMRPGFHNPKYIFPLGYRAQRWARPPGSPLSASTVLHVMEVVLGPDGLNPLFRVTPAGGPAVEAPSLNAAYVALAALQQQQSSLPKPQLRLGAEMFGLTHPVVAELIQDLPGAERCERFSAWRKEPPPVPPLTEQEVCQKLGVLAPLSRSLPPGVTPQVHVAGRGLWECDICGGDVEFEDSGFVHCDSCGVCVHTQCYGVAAPPPQDEPLDTSEAVEPGSESAAAGPPHPGSEPAGSGAARSFRGAAAAARQLECGGRWLCDVCDLQHRGFLPTSSSLGELDRVAKPSVEAPVKPELPVQGSAALSQPWPAAVVSTDPPPPPPPPGSRPEGVVAEGVQAAKLQVEAQEGHHSVSRQHLGLAGQQGGSRPVCALCPVEVRGAGGAMKRTSDWRWAHMVCATWVPEAGYDDIQLMEPIEGIDAVPPARLALRCCLCNQAYGAPIQCSGSRSCVVSFHPMCARMAGLPMILLDDPPSAPGAAVPNDPRGPMPGPVTDVVGDQQGSGPQAGGLPPAMSLVTGGGEGVQGGAQAVTQAGLEEIRRSGVQDLVEEPGLGETIAPMQADAGRAEPAAATAARNGCVVSGGAGQPGNVEAGGSVTAQALGSESQAPLNQGQGGEAGPMVEVKVGSGVVSGPEGAPVAVPEAPPRTASLSRGASGGRAGSSSVLGESEGTSVGGARLLCFCARHAHIAARTPHAQVRYGGLQRRQAQARAEGQVGPVGQLAGARSRSGGLGQPGALSAVVPAAVAAGPVATQLTASGGAGPAAGALQNGSACADVTQQLKQQVDTLKLQLPKVTSETKQQQQQQLAAVGGAPPEAAPALPHPLHCLAPPPPQPQQPAAALPATTASPGPGPPGGRPSDATSGPGAARCASYAWVMGGRGGGGRAPDSLARAAAKRRYVRRVAYLVTGALRRPRLPAPQVSYWDPPTATHGPSLPPPLRTASSSTPQLLPRPPPAPSQPPPSLPAQQPNQATTAAATAGTIAPGLPNSSATSSATALLAGPRPEPPAPSLSSGSSVAAGGSHTAAAAALPDPQTCSVEVRRDSKAQGKPRQQQLQQQQQQQQEQQQQHLLQQQQPLDSHPGQRVEAEQVPAVPSAIRPVALTQQGQGQGSHPPGPQLLLPACCAAPSPSAQQQGPQAPGCESELAPPLPLPLAPAHVQQPLLVRCFCCGAEGSAAQQTCCLSARYAAMLSSTSARITTGKSAIHGWGAFAKVAHAAGDLVVEYAGELIRPVVADVRERLTYDDLVGAGTYIFRLNDEWCVDATSRGNIAHLLNHSCSPCCVSRTVRLTHPLTGAVDDHVIIFATRDIEAGEELTYDYRFSGEEQLVCNCGAQNCRGRVNA